MAQEINTEQGRKNDTVRIEGSVSGIASSYRYAPYMLGSWNDGKTSERSSFHAELKAHKKMGNEGRWSYGFGIDVLGGYNHTIDYRHYNPSGEWIENTWRPGAVRLIELYGEARWRSLYLSAGPRSFGSVLLDDELSSGDFTHSNNARPIPQVLVGFNDFQTIPLTKNWLQINWAVSYGRFFQNSYLTTQSNFLWSIYTQNLNYHYKYIHFRTNPEKPFSVTFGMQATGCIGGSSYIYLKGKLREEHHRGFRLKDVFKILLPFEGSGDEYYAGNSLGSWDLKARYRFGNDWQLSGYFEWPFEDGSGIGKLNGFDGIWGLELKPSGLKWLKRLVVEYLDFTNQSGPIHYAPQLTPGSTITTDNSGADNYYNNSYYGAFSYFGMSLGSPFIMSPFYNLDGSWEYLWNRTRGFHVAANGNISGCLGYIVKLSGQTAYGTGNFIVKHPRKNFSAMVEIKWHRNVGSGNLGIRGRIAIDRGKLRGNNLGAELGVSYSTNFSY